MKIVNGTCYKDDTPDEVVHLLEMARTMGFTVRIFYGDKETGTDWMEENDVHGRVSRSMGPVKVPILLANSRSAGGGALLDDRIVRIKVKTNCRTREWRHLRYRTPILETHPDETIEGFHWRVDAWDWKKQCFVTQALFGTFDRAERYRKFIVGSRFGK